MDPVSLPTTSLLTQATTHLRQGQKLKGTQNQCVHSSAHARIFVVLLANAMLQPTIVATIELLRPCEPIANPLTRRIQCSVRFVREHLHALPHFFVRSTSPAPTPRFIARLANLNQIRYKDVSSQISISPLGRNSRGRIETTIEDMRLHSR
ncbi:hypothetical protein PAXINDRAFT_12770 [Paxillus involutus ATCC 200175]|uniref:Uncharacterized protein n=1 Tax=Paxillus involutus ATCC 200175 TaxID=664439 RepID=A0A0C9SXE8_PAXIN|nr:hypothetical protein PAXINDRAFT_12770 [Paxillus involutus ATCC 200175]